MHEHKHHHLTADRADNSAEDCGAAFAAAQAMDEFESALILAYEQALESGVSPYEALAVLLGLASTETLRLSEPEPAALDR